MYISNYKLLQPKGIGLQTSWGSLTSLSHHNKGIKNYLLLLSHTINKCKKVLFPEVKNAFYGFTLLRILTPGKKINK